MTTTTKSTIIALVLASLPALAAWSQYPSTKPTPTDSPVVRAIVTPPASFPTFETSPVVVTVKRHARKAVQVAYTSYPRQGWHSMHQGPVSRMVRDL
jgi:hypothetical protein